MPRAIESLAGVRLRPEEESDLPFLMALYRTTREQDLLLVAWSEEQKSAFVAMQFSAQRQHYRRTYPGARFEIIERGASSIGRLYVHERSDEIRIIDIVVAPEARNQGIGGALLRALLDEGRRSRRPVTIHVERFNPARRLYDRLGFRGVGGEPDDSVYLFLEARPWLHG
jgi:ribosomal protein S18 acetylase RimI-like enzyme